MPTYTTNLILLNIQEKEETPKDIVVQEVQNIENLVDSNTKGLVFGKIVNCFIDGDKLNDCNLDKIVRISTKKDYLQYLANIKDSKNALSECKKIVEKIKFIWYDSF